MPKGDAFLVSGETYTRIALELRLRQILHDSTIGVELDEPLYRFMLEILKRHPEAGQKIGVGIRAIRITSSKYGNRCFEALRVDGTSAEFSYIKCLKRKREGARG
jgi:hypothetical protein